MAPVAEIRYVALKPLPFQTEEGERLTLAPGDEIPIVMHGRWLSRSVEAGKVAPLPVGLDALERASDADLKAELQSRGYKVTKAK